MLKSSTVTKITVLLSLVACGSVLSKSAAASPAGNGRGEGVAVERGQGGLQFMACGVSSEDDKWSGGSANGVLVSGPFQVIMTPRHGNKTQLIVNERLPDSSIAVVTRMTISNMKQFHYVVNGQLFLQCGPERLSEPRSFARALAMTASPRGSTETQAFDARVKQVDSEESYVKCMMAAEQAVHDAFERGRASQGCRIIANGSPTRSSAR